MISKFTGDFFSKDGIYESEQLAGSDRDSDRRADSPALVAWINIRNYPFLNNKVDYRRDNLLARDVMTPVKDIVYVSDEGWTLDRMGGWARILSGRLLIRTLVTQRLYSTPKSIVDSQ